MGSDRNTCMEKSGMSTKIDLTEVQYMYCSLHTESVDRSDMLIPAKDKCSGSKKIINLNQYLYR